MVMRRFAACAVSLFLIMVAHGSSGGPLGPTQDNPPRWVDRISSAGDGDDRPRAVLAAPQGSLVYVAGTMAGDQGDNVGLAALDGETGAIVWSREIDIAGGNDEAFALAASPSGDVIFVAGDTRAQGSDDYLMMAVEAATGDVRWVSTYDGPAGRGDSARDVAVSPDGQRVFFTGQSHNGFPANGGTSYAAVTLAVAAGTGARLWEARLDTPSDDRGAALGVSPDGTRVYVTGRVGNLDLEGSHPDVLVVAYAAADGAEAWRTQYNSLGTGFDHGVGIVVSRDGQRLFVAAHLEPVRVVVVQPPVGVVAAPTDAGLLAYDAATGDRLWTATVPGLVVGYAEAFGLDLHPEGDLVYFLARSIVWGLVGLQPLTGNDFLTVAYDTDDGLPVWASRFTTGPPHSLEPFNEDIPNAILATRDGANVIVAGETFVSQGSFNFATVAYDARTGEERWRNLYDGPAGGTDWFPVLAATADSRSLIVAGPSDGVATGADFAVLAYGLAAA